MKSLVVVAATVAALFNVDRWELDGVSGLVLGLMLEEDTVYTERYSDAGFRDVRVGMTLRQVETLIGPPESTWSLDDRGGRPGETGARWSRSPGDTHYRSRVLLFRDGRVSCKHSEFYVD